jgi:putative phosphonate metabolism protein
LEIPAPQAAQELHIERRHWNDMFAGAPCFPKFVQESTAMSDQRRNAGSGFPRYAIYYTAARDSVLDRFGAQLLGYDAWTGEELSFPDFATQATPDWQQLTQNPRKYGFHATLKAPMQLASDTTEAELLAACAAFAEKPRTIPVITPVINAISGFIAVVPSEHSGELERLAADCVGEFDCFRAPLTPEDRARRNPSALTPRQQELLDRWGYPYVMEEFRFHMTLTSRLDAVRRPPVLAMLQRRFSDIDIPRLAVDRIVLFRQDNTHARFHIIAEWQLCHADRGTS